MKKDNIKKEIDDIRSVHTIYKKFYNWIIKTYGKDLHGEYQYLDVTNDKGKKTKIKYRFFNDFELSKRLIGHKVISRISKYVLKYCPEIKIIRCDDSLYSGSIILLIPHPKHGITVFFIPQTTNIQNQFFLYSEHYKQLMKALKEMKNIYKE